MEPDFWVEQMLEWHDVENLPPQPDPENYYGQHDHPLRKGMTDRPTDTDNRPTDHRSLINAIWRVVTRAIPSRHLVGLTDQAFGFRKHLAETAFELDRVRYLEVGVRRGHSLAFVALMAADDLEYADGVDLWIDNYGGEAQSGHDGVMAALKHLGIDPSRVTLHSGSSHDVLPLIRDSGGTFNLILVDGDHLADGARNDLADCWEMLEPGGVLVFDDADDGDEGNLLQVWHDFYRGHHDEARGFQMLEAEPPFCWLKKEGGGLTLEFPQ